MTTPRFSSRIPRPTFCILHSAFCIALSATASAATYYASPTGTADAACTAEEPGTIQAAIGKTTTNGSSWETGDEVVLLPGTYDYSASTCSGNTGCIIIPDNRNYLTIRSSSGNPANTIILGGGEESQARAIYASKSRFGLKGLAITNFCYAADGVVARSAYVSYIDLEDCVIAGNKGLPGAALSSPARVVGCVFAGNRATSAGAVFSNGFVGGATNCIFASNSTGGYGGVAQTCAGSFVNCVFTNNAAGSEGGCLSGNSNNRNIYIEGCAFLGNTANAGGAMRLLGGIVTNCTFIGNSATNNNGAVTMYAGLPSFYNCRFEKNEAGGSYGASNNLNVFNCVFVGNHAQGSVGALGLSTATASGCLFSNNWCSTGSSGALAGANNSSPIVTNCVFVNNWAELSEGGAIKSITIKAYDSVFIGNASTNSYGGAVMYGGTYYRCRFERNRAKNGGAAYNGTFYDCSFIGNSADNEVGALSGTAEGCEFIGNYAAKQYGAMGGKSHAWNCTFIGNSATNCGVAVSTSMRNCLLVSNLSFAAGSFLCDSSSFANCTFIDNKTDAAAILGVGAENCIFHGNAPCDVYNGYVTLKNCIYEGVAGNKPTISDCVLTSEPRFNFGRNPKAAWYAPRSRSPAVNAGAEQSWSTNTLDLAGNDRLNGRIDIGCYEFWPSTDPTRLMVK